MKSKKWLLILLLGLGLVLLTVSITRADAVEQNEGNLNTHLNSTTTNITKLINLVRKFRQEIVRTAGNMPVAETVACGEEWPRQEWDYIRTYMKPAAVFPYITTQGTFGIQFTTADPPTLLNGKRGGGFKAEDYGTSLEDPLIDPGYPGEYKKWIPCQCVDFEDYLRQNQTFEAWWLRFLELHGGVDAYKTELEAIGLDPETGTYPGSPLGDRELTEDYVDTQIDIMSRQAIEQIGYDTRPWWVRFWWISLLLALVPAGLFVRSRLRVRVYA